MNPPVRRTDISVVRRAAPRADVMTGMQAELRWRPEAGMRAGTVRPALRTMRRVGAHHVAAIGLFMAVAVVFQWAGGAFSSEYGGFPDEAAHFVTALLVHDFIAGGDWSDPMGFAETFYLHYPKVGLGHWPPAFYVLLAGWMLLFSTSHLSVMLFMAAVTALTAFLLYRATLRELGPTSAITVGLLFVLVPAVQEHTAMVMMEVPMALVCFAGVLRFGRYLDSGHWKDAGVFGALAVLAILMKGTGLALALVPFLGVVLARRWSLMLRPTFYLPAVMVIVLCGPWYWYTLAWQHNGMAEGAPTWAFTREAVGFYAWHTIALTGIGLTAIAAVGLVTRISARPAGEATFNRSDRVAPQGVWAAAGAFVIGLWIFHSIVPCGLDPRHLVPAVPCLLMLLAAGIDGTGRTLRAWSRRGRGGRAGSGWNGLVLALVALLFVTELFPLPRKTWHGFGPVAEQLMGEARWRDSVWLVSSDSPGEGMFIAEVARRDVRPGRLVLRSSKVLSRSRWDGRELELFYGSPAEVMDWLERIPIGVVVLDRSAPDAPAYLHHRQLIETLNTYSNRWELIGVHPLHRARGRHAEAIHVYRLIGHEGRTPEPIRLDMSHMLNREIE